MQNALLTIRRFTAWIIVFIVTVIFIELALSYVNHIQLQNTWKSVASLLRNEVNSSNSYQMSRALSDMEVEGWIKCVKLVETTNQKRIFYDTSTQSYCGFFANHTEGALTAINGSSWHLSFALPPNIWLYVVRLTIPILVLVFEIFIFLVLEKQKRKQEATRLKIELEKEYLLDLTKQTKHDIASPIGAMKIVIQKLDVSEDYREILNGVTERIDRIFKQLKVAEDDLEMGSRIEVEEIDIGKILSYAIREKIKEKSLATGIISLNVNNMKVFGNETELSRIISNILNNAIEAENPNQPLKINIWPQSEGSFVTINISDNGIGIAQDIISRVGQKGFSSKSSSENMGIALYNAKRILHSLGGDFNIQSQPGMGTTIQITLKSFV